MKTTRFSSSAPRGERVVLWCGCELQVTRPRRSTRASRIIMRTGQACVMQAHTLGASLDLSAMLPASERLVDVRS